MGRVGVCAIPHFKVEMWGTCDLATFENRDLGLPAAQAPAFGFFKKNGGRRIFPAAASLSIVPEPSRQKPLFCALPSRIIAARLCRAACAF
jgi:hypothetical protein